MRSPGVSLFRLYWLSVRVQSSRYQSNSSARSNSSFLDHQRNN